MIVLLKLEMVKAAVIYSTGYFNYPTALSDLRAIYFNNKERRNKHGNKF